MSGVAMVTPKVRASTSRALSLSLLSSSTVMLAAKNSAGKWTLIQAVWYASSEYAAACDLLKP